MNFNIFDESESEVRSYCRSFPAVFANSQGSMLYDVKGRGYLDFFAGAGSLNYGHNDPDMIEAVVHYLRQGGILQGLDLHTEAKARFLATFRRIILEPRKLDYKLQFTGPTGANAVEAALKLARKVTDRHTIACFSGGYHGMSQGALAITANATKRSSVGVQVPGIVRLPYDGISLTDVNTQLMLLRDMFTKPGYGVDLPAAFILECVQGEGGLNCASNAWLAGVAQLAKEIGALLIVDDIQAGCGRTGTFFSFEGAGIVPDIVCLSKSLSGAGFPLSLNLIRREIDIWNPGEHNGTFRGNNVAMVTATVALEKFWSTPAFADSIAEKSAVLRATLLDALDGNDQISITGRGLMVGLRFVRPAIAKALSRQLFEDGLIIETGGPNNEVLKCMPALTIDSVLLEQGAARIVDATRAAMTPPSFARQNVCL
ncbi:diaminobutyrate--2-oxoglutarate transaminase [Verminephrobacter aporrectodeae]|uniref:diaminobutyrate--2-oxoglutarate transaminase n=1 Tax=Verminephrobacter aporrectodeae TaxID=1110389 RepID=UPI002243B7DE|nr:diaminobutyrate--2-oxoglutarate transaminase [Verminephrobacter aporrectodeae]MCW8176477.1 diaminobutyrate--2-oxoglutarate transaminase [Verminephrobacter aporrectodeae subsp. tuberculatae]MCW8204164.1 diaminobutyrate--2-oxoglutarate transaminase [Verminephrobacter aporrectodeae subsp. tuberculatae]